MASGVTISVKGLDKILKIMKTFPIEVQKQVEYEAEVAADDMVRTAARSAPHDEGGIQGSINKQKIGHTSKVSMQKTYGIFQEFGTKGKFKAPGYLGNYPSQFRGLKGGSYKEAIASLTGWVNRKGIAGTYSTRTHNRTGNKLSREKQNKQLAYLILRKQLKEGMSPHPYFFPAFSIARNRFLKQVKLIVKAQLRK